MFTEERHKEIIKYLNIKNRVTVADLCKKLYISPATARRDLARLEKSGLLKRSHGGAIIVDGSSSEPPFTFREQIKSDEKSRIAAFATTFISNGQTVFFDTSSTVSFMTKYLEKVINMTAITNCIETAALLSKYSNFNVYCAGGLIRENSHSIVGTFASDFISNFYADIAFISCRGFDVKEGVTEAIEAEAHMKKIMIERAAQTILLCDNSKIGNVNTFRVCDSSRISSIITEFSLSKEDTELMSEKGVIVYTAK